MAPIVYGSRQRDSASNRLSSALFDSRTLAFALSGQRQLDLGEECDSNPLHGVKGAGVLVLQA